MNLCMGQGVDLTKAANNGLSGMHVACKHGHFDIAQAMLSHDETIKDVTSPDGRTPYVLDDRCSLCTIIALSPAAAHRPVL